MLEPQNRPPVQPTEGLSFEEAFTQLGAMVEQLESGGLPLTQAAEMFEQGMALVRRCSELLDETELRITQVRDDGRAPPAPAAAPGGEPDWGDLEMPPLEEDWGPEEDLPNGN